MDIFVECFKDDYIKMGKWRIRPFSILWWIVRTTQLLGAWAIAWASAVLFIGVLGQSVRPVRTLFCPKYFSDLKC